MVDNRLIINHLPRAENGTRTRDLNLGKVALYQLSYFRKIFLPRPGKLRFLRFGTANINRKIYSAKFSGEFCRKITLAPPENAKKRNAGADAIAQACPAPTPRSERQQK